MEPEEILVIRSDQTPRKNLSFLSHEAGVPTLLNSARRIIVFVVNFHTSQSLLNENSFYSTCEVNAI
jgi:hypothetical protein